MTEEQLAEIEQRANAALYGFGCAATACEDVPALVAEVRRLKELLAEAEERIEDARYDAMGEDL